MKVLKWILILFVVCVLVLIAGILFVLNSAGFQKSLVEGALKEQATVETFGYFKAGLSSVKVEDLKLVKDGRIISLQEMAFQYSFMDALFAKEIRIDELIVTGLVIDERQAAPAAAPSGSAVAAKPSTGTPSEAPSPGKSEPSEPKQEAVHVSQEPAPPFKGLFVHGALPYKLFIGEVSVDAKAYLRDGREVTLTVTGGGVEPDATGNLKLAVVMTDPKTGAELRRAEIDGKLALTQNADAEVTQVVLEIDVEAENAKITNAPKLALVADLAQQADKTESYQITLKDVADTAGKPLLAVDATFDPAKDLLRGKADVNVADRHVAAFVPQEGKPSVGLEGNADFSVNTVSQDGSLAAKLLLALGDLQRVRPELANLGEVRVTSELDASTTKTAVTVKTVKAQVLSSAQGQLLELESLQTLTLPTEKGAEMPSLQGEIVKLTVTEFPLSLVQPWLKDMQISGQPLSTSLIVSGVGKDGYNIALPQGLTVRDLTVNKAGQPMLNSLTIESLPAITYAPTRALVDLKALRLTSNGVPLVRGVARVDMDPSKQGEPNGQISAQLSGDLAQLLQQPVLNKYNNLSTGTFSVVFNLDNNNQGAYTLTTELKNLLLRDPMKQVPLMSVDASGRLQAPSYLSIQTPFKVNTAQGNTDVNLDATLKQEGTERHFQASLKGSQLDADGLMLLARAFKNPTHVPPAPREKPAFPVIKGPDGEPLPQGPGPVMLEAKEPALPLGPGPVMLGPDGKPLPAADTTPFWAGNVGTAEVVVDKLYYNQFRLDDATVKLDLTPDKLLVDPLSAGFAGAPLKADTTITFTQGNAEPYDLDSNLTFSNFDVGKFLVQEQPGTTPPVTGLFNVSGGATGQGPTLPVLLQEVQGKFKLEGRDGSLRVLAAAGHEDVGTALGIGLGIASMFQKNKRTGVQVAQQLISVMRNIPYDRFAIDAARGQNLNINLNEMALSGPEIRMNGTGVVTHVNGTAIPNQPLKADVNLQAKGNTAQLMADLKLLSSVQPDQDGFYNAFSFPVGGTPSAPDFSALMNKLLEAGAALALGGGETPNVQERQQTEPQEQQGDSKTNAIKGLLDSFLR